MQRIWKRSATGSPCAASARPATHTAGLAALAIAGALLPPPPPAAAQSGRTARPGSGAPVASRRSVWVDPTRVDLADPAVVARLAALPVQRVIVPVFYGGELLVPVRGLPFPTMGRYAGKPDVLARLSSQAARRGIRVAAAFDCLHWVRADTPAARDVFARTAALAPLMERSLDGGCGRPADGKYASPWHPDVRRLLGSLVGGVAEAYPGVGEAVLLCRFPLGSLLGYSDAARAAYVMDRQIDPIDLTLVGDGDALRLTGDWVNWRLDGMAGLVADVAGAFRRKRPGGRVAAVGYGRWYSLSAGRRNTSLEDWLNWAARGAVDEVLVDGASGAEAGAFALAAALAERAPRRVPLARLTAAPEPGAGAAPTVLLIRSPEELRRAAQAWGGGGAPAPHARRAGAGPAPPAAAANRGGAR